MKTKYKIAVIGLKGLPPFGGAATVGEHIILELRQQFDFTVLSISSHTTLRTGKYQGINQVVFRGKNKGGLNTFIYYLKCLHFCLFKNKFDLIYLHHSASGFITPVLKMKYKIIVTFHGVMSNKIDPKFNKFTNIFIRFSERLNVRYADIVVSVSKSDAAYCEKKFHRKVIFIPNGINMANVQNKCIQDYMCFSANRIYEIKGLHVLLRALKIIKSDKKLVIIGDLNQVGYYKNEIFSLSKDLNVEYLGLLTEKRKII
jgi:glycosyltransferase involved in cell wall biosynthesis